MEDEFVHLFNTMKMGTTVWSPLFGGVLTGKYLNEIPKGSRLSEHANRFQSNEYIANKKEWDEKLVKLRKLSEQLGFTLPELALAWVIRNTDVSTCIVGARQPDQYKENLNALNLLPLYTNKLEQEIENILSNEPTGNYDWRERSEIKNRRKFLINLL